MVRGGYVEGQLFFMYEGEEYIADVLVDISISQEECGISEEREIDKIYQVIKNDREGTIVHRIPEDMSDIIYSSAWDVALPDIDYEPDFDTLAEYRGER